MSLILDLTTAARAMLDAFGGNTPDWLTEEAKALEAALEAVNDAASTQLERSDARSIHASDEIEIDSDALASRADDGTWVGAWVWVPRDDEPVCATCEQDVCECDVVDLEP